MKEAEDSHDPTSFLHRHDTQSRPASHRGPHHPGKPYFQAGSPKAPLGARHAGLLGQQLQKESWPAKALPQGLQPGPWLGGGGLVVSRPDVALGPGPQ